MIPIQYYGVYRFTNRRYDNDQVLNAYGTSSLANGRNVMLYKSEENDEAQQWRPMYAGKYGDHTLYWLNCVLGGIANPFALDRYTGALRNNADVYMASASSTADTLVYFTQAEGSDDVYIHLYGKTKDDDNPPDLVLTAAPNEKGENGNNSPTSLTQAGNVYWGEYTDDEEANLAQRWIVQKVSSGSEPSFSEMVTTFPYEYYYQYKGNSSYPDFVAECVWYCKGRFYEVNGVADCCSGNAYLWETNPIKEKEGVAREVGEPDSITLREKSVAVFGIDEVYTLGHVVFIEELSGDTVYYSDSNGTSLNGKLKVSNSEIEVPSSLFTDARDGKKQNVDASTFRHKFGNGLRAIIYMGQAVAKS